MPRRYTEDELNRNILFEFQSVGSYVRIAAIDPVTNTEVMMVGDRKVGTQHLKLLARNKLVYVLNKKGLLHHGDNQRLGSQPDGSTLT
jgi:hypothetical protein